MGMDELRFIYIWMSQKSVIENEGLWFIYIGSNIKNLIFKNNLGAPPLLLMLEAFITWKIKSEQRSILDFLSPLLKVSFIYYALDQSVNSGESSWLWCQLELQSLPIISVGALMPRGHSPQTAGVHWGKKAALKLFFLPPKVFPAREHLKCSATFKIPLTFSKMSVYS